MSKLDIKSNSASVSVSARLIHQLGEQLISDELVALLELIKNAYDADATIVRVNVDTNIKTKYGIGKIVIEDNGNGMIPSIIFNSFLKISTSFKKKNKVTPFFKRRVLGDKGLGRLSFQRLGDYIRTTTVPRIDRYKTFLSDNKTCIITEDDYKILNTYNKFGISMNWKEFEEDKDIGDVKAGIEYLSDSNPKYGTTIEIFNIKNPSFWQLKKRDEERLKSEVFGMVNPFFKQNSSKFKIGLTVNDKPYTNEKIDEEVLDEIRDVKIKFKFENWKMRIDIERKPRYYNRLKKALVKKMKGLNYKISFEKDNFKLLKSSFTLDFSSMDNVFYEYPFLKDLSFHRIYEQMAYSGMFEGVLYGADFSQDTRKELADLAESNMISSEVRTYNEVKNIWESANGFYIFRNDFRILPYGKKDWAGFTRKSQTYKNNIFKEHTIAGYIVIDGETSENLMEQTNRLGIIEDEYGKNFLKLIQDVLVEIIVRDDVDFREGFTIPTRKLEMQSVASNNGTVQFEREIIEEELKEDVLRDIEHELVNTSRFIATLSVIPTDVSDKIKDLSEKMNKLKDIDEKIKHRDTQEKYIKDRQIEELTELLPVVGQGIIIESLTHELNRIEENIKTYATNTNKALLKVKLEDSKKIQEYQHRIIDETIYLRQQLNHLEPTYRKNRKRLEIISISKFIQETYMNSGPMMKKALDKNVKVTLKGGDFLINANRGYLITIFDNLFLNSLYWLNDSNEKEIVFDINDNGTLIYFDSGPGIHEYLEKDLFEPFKSMKPEGRGLGLYIVKELLSSMDASIKLSEERKNGRLHKFVIKFMNLEEE